MVEADFRWNRITDKMQTTTTVAEYKPNVELCVDDFFIDHPQGYTVAGKLGAKYDEHPDAPTGRAIKLRMMRVNHNTFQISDDEIIMETKNTIYHLTNMDKNVRKDILDYIKDAANVQPMH